ncbi:MAG: UDP-3-O-acyl-N-acetylglucosamine deacetylase, partial [Oscillatoria sp. PMC 1068.18]|nr:UDP-3-O-acyl-N-acetylglucosamine deacetylase [Oscillatoria sp. PMC 1068.18]
MTSTIAKSFALSGVGLHSGKTATVRVIPATAGEGRYFVRVDLPGKPCIPARVEAVKQTTLSTELAAATATVRTVEHLLAALVGCGVDNARIEIDAGEVPLLDGSAQDWVEAIASVGILE